MSKSIRVAVGFVITAVLLALAFRDVDLQQVGSTLATADLRLALPALLTSLAGYMLRARRWESLLAPTKRLKFGMLFSVLIQGFAANNVLPARVGEIIRAHQIGRKAGISRGTGLSTILVERVFDGLVLIAFMAIVVTVIPVRDDQPELRVVELASAGIFLGAITVIVLLLYHEQLAIRLAHFVLRPLPPRFSTRLTEIFESILAGFAALRHPRHLMSITGLSVVVWLLEACSYYLVLLSLNVPLNDVQRMSAALFLVVFVNLGIMIPSAPGYIGTFQLFAKMALSAFGVSAVLGLSVAIIAHALQYGLVTSLGAIFFLKDHITAGMIEKPLNGVLREPALGEPSPD